MSATAASRRPRCEQCADTKFIRNAKIGKVRCPYCTKPRPKRAQFNEAMREITAADKRRLEQQRLSDSLVTDDFKFPNLPTYLVSTDRVLVRWGGEGSGLASENPDVYRLSLPPSLDDRTYVVVNRLVNNSPERIRSFTVEWYCSPMPVIAMADRRGMSRRQLGRMRVEILGALKDKFLASKHADLLALIRFIPE